MQVYKMSFKLEQTGPCQNEALEVYPTVKQPSQRNQMTTYLFCKIFPRLTFRNLCLEGLKTFKKVSIEGLNNYRDLFIERLKFNTGEELSERWYLGGFQVRAIQEQLRKKYKSTHAHGNHACRKRPLSQNIWLPSTTIDLL